MSRKVLIKLALLALTAALLAAFCGCRFFEKPDETPDEIEIPTSEPTEVPMVLDPQVIDSFIGDWYGVYAIGEAAGVYVPNANVSNDCAMRVAVDAYGRGSCYLAVNGMERDTVSGSSNVLALCTAQIVGNELVLTGMINTQPVEWRFSINEGLLLMQGVYGSTSDYMHVNIALARPDQLLESPVTPEAQLYLSEVGFEGVVDKLGGSTSALPAVNPPEGYPAHVFFTEDAARETEPPVTERTVISVDGQIKLTLPEGYEVTGNSVMDFVVACPEKGVKAVDFTVSAWNTDSLSFLLGNTPNVSELYHYTIDGFDFYGTFIPPEDTEEESDVSTVFKLCGTNGSGSLIIINMQMTMDAYSAYSYVNVDNADFTKLILGAEYYVY